MLNRSAPADCPADAISCGSLGLLALVDAVHDEHGVIVFPAAILVFLHGEDFIDELFGNVLGACGVARFRALGTLKAAAWLAHKNSLLGLIHSEFAFPSGNGGLLFFMTNSSIDPVEPGFAHKNPILST